MYSVCSFKTNDETCGHKITNTSSTDKLIKHLKDKHKVDKPGNLNESTEENTPDYLLLMFIITACLPIVV